MSKLCCVPLAMAQPGMTQQSKFSACCSKGTSGYAVSHAALTAPCSLHHGPRHHRPWLRRCGACLWQAIQYVPPGDLVLESGTRDPGALPAALYGCPYPPSKQADGACRPPPACNCYGGICYGEC